MDENKFVIQSLKYTGETAVTSVRLPKNMIDDIEKISIETGRTKNEIISMCIEYALKNLKIEK